MNLKSFTTDASYASEADLQDPLKAFRDKFHHPKLNGKSVIYLCGNSLGLQPLQTASYIQEELEDWAKLGVEGHFEARHPWLPYHTFLTEPGATLVGALPEEIVHMNHLTVNLHLLMVSFYQPTPERPCILIEKGAFPSDQYAVASQLRFHGFDPKTHLLELGPRPGENCLRTEDIEAYLAQEGHRIALVLWGGINYYTGEFFDLKRITQAAHAAGAKIGFDLAHAAGNVELNLHDSAADFAAWCTYKYLNGGPGGVGGVFIHQRHLGKSEIPRFEGWWGHTVETRFKMGPTFEPMKTAEAWQLSNAPVLSMAALRASYQLFMEAGMPALLNKSKQLTAYLEFLLLTAKESKGLPIEIITPKEPQRRGCQLSIRTPEDRGEQWFHQLTQQGVIADWRFPDVIRVAPVPLYNTFTDVYRFANLLIDIITKDINSSL
ncbi:MAG: kynureninase [Sphingobacteriia bacterium]|nr:kynureninase [Sphingobacteriia bacterium]